MHRTVYTYSTPASDSHNEVRLKPVDDAHQRCLGFDIRITPEVPVFEYQALGGTVHYFTIREPHKRLEICVDAEVETIAAEPFAGINLITPDWDEVLSESYRQRFAEYLTPSPYVSLHQGVRELARSVRNSSDPVISKYALDLSTHLFETLAYDPDVTHVHTTVDEVLELQAGVCQDFAHLMIACCRCEGVAARYVSGYLYSSDPEGLRGTDAMHAWVECAMPDGRWFAVDPTNNLVQNELYVRVHDGCDYSEVSPTRGIYVGTVAATLDVELRAEQLIDTT